jgi:hypothetical protein
MAQTASMPAAASLPRTYGSTAVSYASVPAVAMFPQSHYCTYITDFDNAFRWGDTCMPSTKFLAPVTLPNGAKIVSLIWKFLDGSSSDFGTAALVTSPILGGSSSSYPSAGAGPQDCLTPGVICTGLAFTGGPSSITADLTPDNLTVDNLNKVYTLEGVIPLQNGGVGTGAILVGYVLQVSPAPVVATFNDVPTADFAFQFIEAFNAAGITVGCNASPPQFCPDRNVTRREMAVFFAKALGLQFP